MEDLARLSIKNKPVYVGVDDAEQESTVDGLEQVMFVFRTVHNSVSQKHCRICLHVLPLHCSTPCLTAAVVLLYICTQQTFVSVVYANTICSP